MEHQSKSAGTRYVLSTRAIATIINREQDSDNNSDPSRSRQFHQPSPRADDGARVPGARRDSVLKRAS